jgi:hypothetical protein
MRMLCVELEQNIEAHYCRPAPNGEVCRPIYTRQPGKIQCRWGIECRQTSCHHWMKQGHPPGHALLKTQTETPSWTLSSVPDCRHLRRSGRCFHRDGWCRFAHWDLSAAAASVEPWLVAAADAIPITSLRSCDTPSAARQRAPRASRGKACAVFRRFLLDTFGIDRLRSGGGVLDVAGGAGSLSFELVNLNEVPCVIVDPRHPCFRRARQVVTHRRRQWAATADRSMLLRYDHQQTEIGEPLRAPLWLQAWFGPWLYDDGSPSTHMPDETSQQDDARGGRPPAPEPEPAQLDGGQLVGNAKGAGAGAKGGRGRRTGEGGSSSGGPGELAAVRVEESEIKSVLVRSSVVVGLHPDGATDAIVEFALQTGKPFAIIPCCIFSKQFPNRRTASGSTVKTPTPPGFFPACCAGFPGRLKAQICALRPEPAQLLRRPQIFAADC